MIHPRLLYFGLNALLQPFHHFLILLYALTCSNSNNICPIFNITLIISIITNSINSTIRSQNHCMSLTYVFISSTSSYCNNFIFIFYLFCIISSFITYIFCKTQVAIFI